MAERAFFARCWQWLQARLGNAADVWTVAPDWASAAAKVLANATAVALMSASYWFWQLAPYSFFAGALLTWLLIEAALTLHRRRRSRPVADLMPSPNIEGRIEANRAEVEHKVNDKRLIGIEDKLARIIEELGKIRDDAERGKIAYDKLRAEQALIKVKEWEEKLTANLTILANVKKWADNIKNNPGYIAETAFSSPDAGMRLAVIDDSLTALFLTFRFQE